ncbi:hypothetical protein HMPREF9554_02451 [Treponema phagedenis F0421]|nr:hypothetical protein HMPREF9554_02451 [Treponema phagedenis F0421]
MSKTKPGLFLYDELKIWCGMDLFFGFSPLYFQALFGYTVIQKF